MMPQLKRMAVWIAALQAMVGAAAPGDPHDPQGQVDSFQMRRGFEANLFAAEPMIGNPIHMTWDPEGRLWVVCSSTYPHLNPGDHPDDRIIILEDTHGDGTADKSTVFADGLYIPTGLALGDGGAYVANQSELLFLKDTDGDDEADVRRTMLSGFGLADSHHAMSAWTWGPGGWIYFQEGTFMKTNVETPHGVTRLVNGGVFQYRPREQRLRVYADYAASNPWGHDFDRWGQGILVDNPRLFFIAPMTANNRTKIPYDASTRGATKHSGGQFVSGRHLPKEYRGEFWTAHYKSHDIVRYRPVDDGAGMKYEVQEPVLKSDNRHFRPVDLEVGPRGAVYVLDWYDALIGHMQHSLRDPRRDKRRGRIWRITYKDRELIEKPALTNVALDELLDHLKDPEDWTRYQVKRVLYDTNRERAAAALEEWVDSLDPSESGFEHHRLEALWAFQTIRVVNEGLLRRALQADEPRARAAAVRVLRDWHRQVSDPLRWIERAVTDDHPRVRMEGVLTASFIERPAAARIAMQALDRRTDRYVEHALERSVDALQSHWLPAYQDGSLQFKKPEHRSFALSNVRSSDTVGHLVGILVSGSVDPVQLEQPLRFVANEANAKQLSPLMNLLLEQTRGPATTWGVDAMPYEGLARIMDALAEAGRRGVRPGSVNALLNRTRGIEHSDVRLAWVRLAGAVGSTGGVDRLRQIVNDDEAGIELQGAAARSLGRIGRKQDLRFLRGLGRDGPTRAAALAAIGLTANDLEEAAEQAAAVLARPPAELPLEAMLDAFLRREEGPEALAQGLAEAPLHSETAARAIDYLNRIGEQDAGLLAALRRTGSDKSLLQRLLDEDPEALAADVREYGRPMRGQRLFFEPQLACARCHGLAGAGPELGPDLATVGSSSPLDYLIESLLQPNRVIKEGFHAVTVITKTGRVHHGLLEGEDDETVRLRHAATNEPITIAASRIEERKDAPSLMPEALVNQLADRRQVLDLLAYLNRLGRPGDYEPTEKPVLREWQITGLKTEVETVTPEDVDADAGWREVFTTVQGKLPPWLYAPGDQTTVAARSRIELSQAGRLRLGINSLDGIAALWVDGKPVNLTESPVVSLESGEHILTCVIDVARRGTRPLCVTAARIN